MSKESAPSTYASTLELYAQKKKVDDGEKSVSLKYFIDDQLNRGFRLNPGSKRVSWFSYGTIAKAKAKKYASKMNAEAREKAWVARRSHLTAEEMDKELAARDRRNARAKARRAETAPRRKAESYARKLQQKHDYAQAHREGIIR